MSKNFHRVGKNIASKFLDYAGFDRNRDPKTLSNDEITKFVRALHRYNGFLQPDASCLSPLGEEILMAGIKKELEPEFITTTTRPPSAYSGFPFIVEVGLAYGGKILPKGLKLFRFANRIPLLYDEANDVVSKVLNEEIDWRRYKIPEDAPLAIITHVCSTKIPYKTVGKEYLADRPELERELKNAIREVLRKLSLYLSRKVSIEMDKRRFNIYGKYLPLIAKFSKELSGAKKLPDYKKLLEMKKFQKDIEEYINVK
jgi:DNA topoisomerase-6 subunit B